MELLLMNQPDNHAFMLGDIIDARQDGFEWGMGERVDPFRIVSIPDAIVPGATFSEKRAFLVAPLNYADGLATPESGHLRIRRVAIQNSQMVLFNNVGGRAIGTVMQNLNGVISNVVLEV